MRVVIIDSATLSKFTVQGTARVLFYDPPYITSISPAFGDINGGNILQIYGQNFDVSFGSLQCMFGTVQVPA